MADCSIDGCNGRARKRGWCDMHYKRWRVTGKLERTRPEGRQQCSVEGCGLPVKGRGFCNKHYVRWQRSGTTDLEKSESSPLCSVSGCERLADSRGWCLKHYTRWRRNGDPEAVKTTITGEPWRFYREVVLLWECDDCLIWPYGPKGNYYGRLWESNRPFAVHRLVCIHFHGEPPSDQHQAAHTCGNRKCCNWRHIRWASPTENNADKILHGTRQNGERNGNSKLTWDQVGQIRALSGQMSQRKIAATFNVSQRTVWNILHGKIWHAQPDDLIIQENYHGV